MKEQPMNLDTAWRKFHGGRDSRPSETDFEQAREIMDVLGATEFKILQNYISDVGNQVHINVGFLASKVEVPYVSWDETYEAVGFPWRLKFSNFGEPGGLKSETKTSKLSWCWMCGQNGHSFESCSVVRA